VKELVKQEGLPPCAHLCVDVMTPMVVQCRRCGARQPMAVFVDGQRVTPLRYEGWDAQALPAAKERTLDDFYAKREGSEEGVSTE
jgi:hypothetical protein